MSRIGFIGIGHYGAALAEGMFAKSGTVGDPLCNVEVIAHDTNRLRAESLAARVSVPVSIVDSAKEVFASADITFLGIPTDQVAPVLADFPEALEARQLDKGVLLMDGIKLEEVRAINTAIPVGIVMFNYPVKYRSGISALWPGSLSTESIALAQACLQSTGETWVVDSPAQLSCIRATAGCGFGLLAQLAVELAASMDCCGLDDAKRNAIVRSLISGLAGHLNAGGTFHSARALTASTRSPIMATLLCDMQRMELEPSFRSLFRNALSYCEGRQ